MYAVENDNTGVRLVNSFFKQL